MEFLKNNPKWIRQPKQVQISEDKVVILTERGTDLWARTYYGFQNDNAPVFQVETTDKYFSFIVKTEFESTCRFDQCGVAMYLNSDNWFKASIEYENKKIQRELIQLHFLILLKQENALKLQRQCLPIHTKAITG